MQKATDFIATQAFPSVPVENQSDSYYIFDSVDFRRNNAKARAPGTESAGGGFNLSTATYSAEEYSIHKDIPDPIRANADAAVDLDKASAEFVMQQLLIQKDVNWVADYFGTGKWGTDVVGSTNFTQWDDGTSDPEADVDTGKATIKQNTGLNANTLIVDYNTHLALKRHPIIMDRYKHTSPESITKVLLARYFEVERYLVAEASYTTSEEGETEVNAFIAGKNALLCYVAPTPGLMTPSAGYTFNWTKLSGSNGGVRMKRFRMEKLNSDRIEGSFAYDQKLVLAAAGYFFSATVS